MEDLDRPAVDLNRATSADWIRNDADSIQRIALCLPEIDVQWQHGHVAAIDHRVEYVLVENRTVRCAAAQLRPPVEEAGRPTEEEAGGVVGPRAVDGGRVEETLERLGRWTVAPEDVEDPTKGRLWRGRDLNVAAAHLRRHLLKIRARAADEAEVAIEPDQGVCRADVDAAVPEIVSQDRLLAQGRHGGTERGGSFE